MELLEKKWKQFYCCIFGIYTTPAVQKCVGCAGKYQYFWIYSMIFQWNFRKLFVSQTLHLLQPGSQEYRCENRNNTHCSTLSWRIRGRINITTGVRLKSGYKTFHSNSHLFLPIVLLFTDLFATELIYCSPWIRWSKMGKYFCVLHCIVRCVAFYIANLYIFERHLACTLRICKNILLKMVFSKNTTFSLSIFYHKNWFISWIFYIV